MPPLSEDALKAQLTTLLQAYTSAAKDAGIQTPITVSDTGALAISSTASGDITQALSSLTTLGDLNTMTQIPTTWSGVVNMLPQTGMFSMQAMVWSTVGSFVFLWLLWYSKERAKARIWARAFHKQAKKFMKEYREEEKEHIKELRKAEANEASHRELSPSLETPQSNTRPDMASILGPGTAQIPTPNPIPPQTPQTPSTPQINIPFHL